jgi:hypothetical protein
MRLAPKWRLQLELRALAEVAAALAWPTVREGTRLFSLRSPSCGRGGFRVAGPPTNANLAHRGRRYWHQRCRSTGGAVELLSAALHEQDLDEAARRMAAALRGVRQPQASRDSSAPSTVSSCTVCPDRGLHLGRTISFTWLFL